MGKLVNVEASNRIRESESANVAVSPDDVSVYVDVAHLEKHFAPSFRRVSGTQPRPDLRYIKEDRRVTVAYRDQERRERRCNPLR
jgi:hypothetical protein